LSRSLFGDFDIDEIMSNSSGYSNVLLFLVYLFVAVFIMLSMFFAILGESQANLRDDQRQEVNKKPEYGIFETGYDMLTNRVLLKAPLVGDNLRARREARRVQAIKADRSAQPQAVDRIEARQLELTEQVETIGKAIDTLTASIKTVTTKVASLEGAFDRSSDRRAKPSDNRSRPPAAKSGRGEARPPSRGESRSPSMANKGGSSKNAKEPGRSNGRISDGEAKLRERGSKLEEQQRRKRSVSPDSKLQA